MVYADDFAKLNDYRQLSYYTNTANFGDQSYLENGDLNTGLANQAFNQDRVNELNSIIHPILWKNK